MTMLGLALILTAFVLLLAAAGCGGSGDLLRLTRERALLLREQARMRISWYMECFCNTRRRHSSLGCSAPPNTKQRHQQEAIAA
jgi:hypothetical protein